MKRNASNRIWTDIKSCVILNLALHSFLWIWSYGRFQGGMEGDARGKAGRRLTMKDALSYVREVKDAFRDQPKKYDIFLEIMKDFNTERYTHEPCGDNRTVNDLTSFLWYRAESIEQEWWQEQRRARAWWYILPHRKMPSRPIAWETRERA